MKLVKVALAVARSKDIPYPPHQISQVLCRELEDSAEKDDDEHTGFLLECLTYLDFGLLASFVTNWLK